MLEYSLKRTDLAPHFMIDVAQAHIEPEIDWKRAHDFLQCWAVWQDKRPVINKETGRYRSLSGIMIKKQNTQPGTTDDMSPASAARLYPDVLYQAFDVLITSFTRDEQGVLRAHYVVYPSLTNQMRADRLNMALRTYDRTLCQIRIKALALLV